MISPEEQPFAALIAKISRATGLALEAYKHKCLRRRIAVRMRASGVQSFAEYEAVLDRNPEEYERLKDAITINVTQFYRNAETWDRLRSTVLTEICADGSSEVRAWSAGCSSGEEPYTLTMLIADHFESRGRSEQLKLVTVDATDIDRGCLARAQEGRYPRESLADVPPGLADRYFDYEGGRIGLSSACGVGSWCAPPISAPIHRLGGAII